MVIQHHTNTPPAMFPILVKAMILNVERSSMYASFEMRKPSVLCYCTWTHKICRDDEGATLSNSSHNKRCTYNTANNMQDFTENFPLGYSESPNRLIKTTTPKIIRHAYDIFHNIFSKHRYKFGNIPAIIRVNPLKNQLLLFYQTKTIIDFIINQDKRNFHIRLLKPKSHSIIWDAINHQIL